MSTEGDWNTGNWNTGNWNTGNRNTGNWNTGHSNTGHSNTGNWNTGHSNTGDSNTGNWNTGNRNTGFFCTETPSPTFFDLPCGLSWEEAFDAVPWVDLPVGAEWVPLAEMTDAQKQEFPNHATIGGCLIARDLPLREAFPQAWSKLDDATKQRFLDLPNFDAEKFLAITGVDVRETSPAVPSEVVVDGRRYVLAD